MKAWYLFLYFNISYLRAYFIIISRLKLLPYKKFVFVKKHSGVVNEVPFSSFFLAFFLPLIKASFQVVTYGKAINENKQRKWENVILLFKS